MAPPGPEIRRVVNVRPGRIALGYVVIGLAWIFGTGFLVQMPPFAAIEPSLEIFKGAGFVLVTAGGLYVLLARRSRAIDAAQRELIAVDDQRARLVAAVEQSAEAIVITDVAARIIYVNPALERISGYDRAELLGGNPNIVRSGRHDSVFWHQVWATLLAGETWHGRFINRRKDGATYEMDSVITPVRDHDGAIVSYVGVQHDTSRERALERHLAEAGRLEAIGQLAGGIAHDFNNLLTVISGHAELLSAGKSLDAEARDDVAQIARAAGSAASLVNQLLAFSRRQVLQPAVIDLESLVDQLRPMLAGLLGPTIRLEVKSQSSPGVVFADAGQLEQVIINLAVNARDAMPSGGTFTMALSSVDIDELTELPAPVSPGRYALLTATDTGSGMDAATRTRVFEPFFTTKPQGRGTGLGLATAYGIVNQSGGYLLVESELGRGSTFTVFLPHHDGSITGQLAESPRPVPRGSETVLVVEDEEPVRAVIDRSLRQLGYDVIVAADSSEALGLAAATTPSILVTDVRLPGLDGPALAARITELHPGLPVLFVSGYASELMIDGGVLGEDAAFLAKPFAADDLGRRVRELLDGARR
jgi:PAS domain S-box-containing protein